MLRLINTRFNQTFSQWALGYVTIEKDDWLSVDGKSIKSTLENPNSAYQNFVSMVSVFSQKRGQVIKTATFENKKASEVPIVQELLETLDLKNVVFTLDALHCKKNFTRDRNPGESLPSEAQTQST